MRQKLIEELEFCIKLWKEQGHCEFGGYTNCKNCATPYLLLKLITGEILHGKEIRRLTLEDWENKIKEIKSP